MEQRPLRLGDIVDDYCPRERRITNHAIVALVGEDIRQTRCSTCDAEHVFRGGQVPKRTALRRKDGDTARTLVTPRPGMEEASPPPVAASAAVTEPGQAPTPAGVTPSENEALAAADDTPHGHEDHVDGWLAQRPLIRATLPRTEGDVPTPRPIPEFTMHQRQARGGRAFRQSYGWSGGGGNQPNGGFRNGRPVDGNVPGGNGSHDRHGNGHGRQGHGGGHGRGGPPGSGGGRPGRHRGGGSHHNKRSR